MRELSIASCAGVLLALVAAQPSLAKNSFFGTEVTGGLFYPNLATPGPSVTKTVGASIEFPVGTLLVKCCNTLPSSFDVTKNEVLIHNYFTYNFPHDPFNGVVLTFSGAPKIIGVTGTCTNCVSGTLPGEGFGFTSNSFFTSASGASIGYGDSEVFHFTFAPSPAPEPASWTLLLIGLGIIGLNLRSTGNPNYKIAKS